MTTLNKSSKHRQYFITFYLFLLLSLLKKKKELKERQLLSACVDTWQHWPGQRLKKAGRFERYN